MEPGRLRFDFPHPSAVPEEQLQEAELIANRRLARDDAPSIFETSMDEAKRLGAVMLFGEKYGDNVRVVEIGDYSRELCGGTHVERTGNIGVIRLLHEGSIGAGMRRVEALVGPDALREINAERALLHGLVDALGSNDPRSAIEHARKVIEENKRLRSELGKLQKGDRDAIIASLVDGGRGRRRPRARRLGGTGRGRERSPRARPEDPRPPAGPAGRRRARRGRRRQGAAGGRVHVRGGGAGRHGARAPPGGGDRHRRRGRRQGHPRDGRRPGRIGDRPGARRRSPRAPASSSRLADVAMSDPTRAPAPSSVSISATRGSAWRSPTPTGGSRCPSAPCTSGSRRESCWRSRRSCASAAPPLIVIGLPLSLRGERGERAAHAESFAEALRGRPRCPDRAARRAPVDRRGGARARGRRGPAAASAAAPSTPPPRP